MRLGVRGRLFLVSLALILTTVAIGGLYLEARLRTQLENLIESELFHQASTARELVRKLPDGSEVEQFDPVADALGRAADARITIINGDGLVLGDSRLSIEQLRRVENHAKRPEVREALASGRGQSRRYSATLGTYMLYLALPCEIGGSRGVVRIARNLSDVDRSIGGLRLMLLIAALLAMGAAVIMSALASHFYSRTLRRIVKGARRLADERGGHIMPVSTSDEIGGLVGSINRMSTELEELLSTLAAERNRFETVLEGIGEGVIALDSSRRISHVNRTAQTLLGLERPPLGKTLSEVLRQPAVFEMLPGLVPGKLSSCEIELGMEDGARRKLLVRAMIERDQKCLVIVLHDVTKLRRLEKVRQDFVANVSHELRTPASVILANVETLLGGALEDPDSSRVFMEGLKRGAERLSTLIEELLDVSRVDSDSYQVATERVELRGIVEGIVASVAPNAEEKKIEIEMDGEESVLAQADHEALGRVLSNLVDNAVKYVQAGGKIWVRLSASQDKVRIEVIDNGPGIELRHQQRIFERFYRVDKGRSRQMGGYGLGLSIAKNLTESMNGTIGYQANHPSGSVFWIELPRAQAT